MMGITLNTNTGQTLSARQHALLNEYAIKESGILYGCEITYSGNTITVGDGYGVICGRLFTIESTDFAVQLPASGESTGTVLITLDLSNMEAPLTMNLYNSGSAPEITQEDNVNVENGVYMLRLCDYTASSAAVTGLTSYIADLAVSATRSRDGYYHKGDTVSLFYYGAAVVPKNRTRLRYFVPLSKPVGSDVSTFRVLGGIIETVSTKTQTNDAITFMGVPEGSTIQFDGNELQYASIKDNGIYFNVAGSWLTDISDDIVPVHMAISIKFQ